MGLASYSQSAIAPERHVALFIPHLAVGGSELQLLTLARHLPARGFRPVVVTLERREGVAELFQAAGVKVHLLPRRGRAGVDSIVALSRYVRVHDIRLVHAWLWAANWRAAIARWLVPVPVIFAVRGLENDLGLAQSLAYRALSRMASRIIVNSETIRARSVERTGRPELYRVVCNGIDVAALESAAGATAPPEQPVVGYLGSVTARKRADSLARIALEVLRHVPSTRFLIVGEGDRLEALRSECDRLGLAPHFEFAGRRTDVGHWLSRMTVFVHPSLSEGRSNAVLEAQALGVPVAAYAIPGNVEAMLDGETGLLVADGDERALAGAIVELLRDGPRRVAMAARARTFVRERFSIDVMVEDTVAVYRSVLEAES